MQNVKLTETITVFNRPFFVNTLLKRIRPGVITPEKFAEIVAESSVFDLNTILTAMTRQVDASGLIPNLAGVYDDAQDALEILMNMGHEQLLKIASFDEELQEEIFDTLKGGRGSTLRALLVLDECQKEVVGRLAHLRQRSPLAQAIHHATERAVRELYREVHKFDSPMFDDVISYDDRCVIYTGEPRICYPKRVHDGSVVEVWQFFFMPKISDVRLAHPFEPYHVGEVIHMITPRQYRRDLIDDSTYNPRTPAGFIGLLGKVGGALPRLIAHQVKKNEQLHERIMREEESAEALVDFFSR